MRVGPGGNADTTDCMIDSELISDSSNPAVDPETFLQTFLNPEYVRDGEEDARANKKHVRKKRPRSELSPSKKLQDSKMASESEESESEDAAASSAKSLQVRKSLTKLSSGRNHRVTALGEGRPRERLSSRHPVDGERAVASPEKTCRAPLSSDNSETATRLRRRKESPTELPPGKARTVSTSSLEQDDVTTKKKHVFTSPERCDPRKQKAQQQATHASNHQGGLPSNSSSATSSAALLAGQTREPLNLSADADEAEVVSPSKKLRRTRKRSSTVEEAEEMQIPTPRFAHGSQQRRSPTKVSFGGSCMASSLEKEKPKEASLNSSNHRGLAALSRSRKSPSVTPDDEPGKQLEQRRKPARSLSERTSPAKPHSSQVPSTSKPGTVLEESSLSVDAEVTGKQAGSSKRKARRPAELETSDDEVQDLSMQKGRKRSATLSSCSTTCIVSSSEEGDRQVSSKNSGNRRGKMRKSATPGDKWEEPTLRKRRIFPDLRQEQSPARPAYNKICDTSSDEEASEDIQGTKDDSETTAVSPPKEAHTSRGRHVKKTSPRALRHAESLPQEKSPVKCCATLDASLKDSEPQKSDSSSSDEDNGNAEVISVNTSSDNGADGANNETESFSSSEESQHGNQASSATEEAKSPGESRHQKMASKRTETDDSDSSAAPVGSLQLPQVSTNDSDSSERETANSESDEPHDRGEVLSFKDAFSGNTRSNKASLATPGALKAGIQKESSDAQKVSRSYTPNGKVMSVQSTMDKVSEKSVDDIVVPDSQECASSSKDASSEHSSMSSEKTTDTSSPDLVIPETQELSTASIKTTQVTDAAKQGLPQSAPADEDMPPSQESNCLDGLTQVPSIAERDSGDESSRDKDVHARPPKNTSGSAVLRTPARERSQSPRLRPRSSRQSAIKARRKLIRTPEREEEGSPESKSDKPRRMMTPSDDSDSDPDFSLGKKKILIGFKPRTPNFGSSRVENVRQLTVGSGDEADASQGSRKPSKLSLSSQACLNETNNALCDTTTPQIKIEGPALKKQFDDLATLTPPQATERQATKSLPSSTPTCKMAEANVEGAKNDSENDFTMAVSAKACHSKAAEKRSRTSVCQKPSPAAATPKFAETITQGLQKDSSTRATDEQRTEDAGRSSRSLSSSTRLANVSQAATQPMEAGSSSASFQSPSSESELSVDALIDSLSRDNDNVVSQTPRLSGSLEKSCCYCSGTKKTRTSEIGTMTDVSFGEASVSQASSGGRRTKRDSTGKLDSLKRAKGRRKSACSLTTAATPPQAATVRKAVTSRYNLRMSLSVPRRLKY
uniref:Putative proteophosphoglycan ppg4 braziliensis mhom/br/75/m2904 proteophosphoglycan ppg4 n=2 Tax=Ixodes ricinus TaxID=34613 RepID=V5HUM9_IXORI